MQKIAYSKHKKSFLVLLLIASLMTLTLFVLIKKLALFTHDVSFFTPSNITYEIQNSENITMQHAIIDFITEKTCDKNLLSFDRHLFYAQLKSTFPHIDNLEWKMLPAKTLHMTIDMSIPELIINNQYVVGHNNKLLDIDLFNQSEIDNLPHINIHDSLVNEKLDPILFSFTQAIPDELFEIFDIEYYSESKVLLKSKADSYHYQITTDVQSLPDQKKLDYIKTIFKDLKQKNIITNWRLKKQHGPFVFDMRIKNQIIVKLPEPLKRGRGI